MDSANSRDRSRDKEYGILPEFKFDHYEDNLEGKSGDFGATSSRLEFKKSSPELDNLPKHWAIVSEGFPPGVTVDELKNYGRRRQLTHLRPQDNLRLEEGSLKPYKSEYKRRYLAYAPLKNPPKLQETNKSKEEKEKQPSENYFNRRPILRRPQNNLLLEKDHPMESMTEKNSKFVPFPNYERRKLLRRSTALRPEGEMANETEVRKEYIGYTNPEKALIIRRLPSIRLEGELEPLTTEQRDKYIAYLLGRPRILEKKKTSLKMEGDFDFLTEKKLSYVPHAVPERPRIRKRSTSLKLDGEVDFFPEYRKSFVDFPRSRPITYKPNGNIRHDGEFQDGTETKTQFVNFENVPVPESAKPENNLHVEGDMEISPEYKINFVDFPRERPFLRRPLNQLKPEGNLQILTESSERFSDVGGVEKSGSLRRPNNLTLNGGFHFLSENTDKFKKHQIPDRIQVPKLSSSLKLEGEIDFLTEKADKFGVLVPERGTTARRPSNLKLEGEFLFLPEYKRSYVNFGKGTNPHLKTLKSNPPSPRKKPKDKLSLTAQDNQPNLETPSRKSNSKRLKEATPEKVLQFEIPQDSFKSEGLEERRRLNYHPRLPEIPPSDTLQTSPKTFSAFQVLDVKGEVGCQKMNAGFESDKSTSDEENATYRLEVSNAGQRSPDLFKKFPSLEVNMEEITEAEKRARQRAENFVKVVKSPEIPNYLLGEGPQEDRWKVPEKLCPLSSPQEDLSKRAFVVLD